MQFDHRMVGYAIAVLGTWQGLRVARITDDEQARRSGLWLAVCIFAQIGLGIWTLLEMVPLWLGLAHQAMAMGVLAIAVWHRHAVLRA